MQVQVVAVSLQLLIWLVVVLLLRYESLVSNLMLFRADLYLKVVLLVSQLQLIMTKARRHSSRMMKVFKKLVTFNQSQHLYTACKFESTNEQLMQLIVVGLDWYYYYYYLFHR